MLFVNGDVRARPWKPLNFLRIINERTVLVFAETVASPLSFVL